MEIKKIKINSFGKLKNKNLNLQKINIIFGKNEAGKSTLLNFIINILYNISKNKNGKKISDYEKYYPWNDNEFSGKIIYELDNKEKYEVFRDFNKKDVEIYNENGNNISKKYNIDKKIGNLFFYEQVNVDKETMLSTVVAAQNETKIDSNKQNELIQKVANLAESGDEEVSYKKAISTLDKLLLTEVGTNKSQDRPINIVKNNIIKYQKELDDIKNIEQTKIEIENKNEKIKKQILNLENEKNIYEKIFNIFNCKKIKKEQINIKRKIYEENKNKIIKLKNNKELNKNNKKLIIFLFILIIINFLSLIFIKNKIINIFFILLIPIYLIIYFLKNKNLKLKNISIPVQALEDSNKELNNEIYKLEEEINNYIFEEKNKLINLYGNYVLEYFEENNIEKKINDCKKEIDKLSLDLHKLELDMNNIEPKLEKMVDLEELLDIELNNLEKLENKSKIFNITKEILNESYDVMKQNITPKFNKNLSKNIEILSDGKYQNIITDEDILIELDNGKRISIDRLSNGTIEQIYFALRLSIIDSISNEKLPILLDETFAFYDDDRLEQALKLLVQAENQIIIFTCTQREKAILEEHNVDFNYIEL